MIGSIAIWIIMGLIVGAIARVIVSWQRPMGIIGTIILGIVGALVGGLISWTITGAPEPTQGLAIHAWPGWIMSVFGAIVVLWAGARFFPR